MEWTHEVARIGPHGRRSDASLIIVDSQTPHQGFSGARPFPLWFGDENPEFAETMDALDLARPIGRHFGFLAELGFAPHAVESSSSSSEPSHAWAFWRDDVVVVVLVWTAGSARQLAVIVGPRGDAASLAALDHDWWLERVAKFGSFPFTARDADAAATQVARRAQQFRAAAGPDWATPAVDIGALNANLAGAGLELRARREDPPVASGCTTSVGGGLARLRSEQVAGSGATRRPDRRRTALHRYHPRRHPRRAAPPRGR